MSYGLAARPELSPEELAALVVALREVFLVRTSVELDEAPAWRFSGRWFNAGPFALRRPHYLN